MPLPLITSNDGNSSHMPFVFTCYSPEGLATSTAPCFFDTALEPLIRACTVNCTSTVLLNHTILVQTPSTTHTFKCGHIVTQNYHRLLPADVAHHQLHVLAADTIKPRTRGPHPRNDGELLPEHHTHISDARHVPFTDRRWYTFTIASTHSRKIQVLPVFHPDNAVAMYQHRRPKHKKTPTSPHIPYPTGFTSATVAVTGSGTGTGSVLTRGTIRIGAACASVFNAYFLIVVRNSNLLCAFLISEATCHTIATPSPHRSLTNQVTQEKEEMAWTVLHSSLQLSVYKLFEFQII